jgi:hypothetical protein
MASEAAEAASVEEGTGLNSRCTDNMALILTSSALTQEKGKFSTFLLSLLSSSLFFLLYFIVSFV